MCSYDRTQTAIWVPSLQGGGRGQGRQGRSLQGGALQGRAGKGALRVTRLASRCSPVSVERASTSCEGVPSNTMRPPSCPAPGPRSMIQSACAITA